MPLRPPPGRSGRLWLAHRLATAGRGAALLDQKRLALVGEARRLAAEAATAAAGWERAAREAERWQLRASLVGGQRPFSLVRAHTRRPAAVEVRWRDWMGIRVPVEGLVVAGEPGPTALGGSSALDLAAAAHEEALAAAVRSAVAARALELVRADLAATTRRQRVLERRWIPLLDGALARLEQALDEQEREDGVRGRWLRSARVTSRGGGAGAER